MKKALVNSAISHIVTSCCIFVYVVLAGCAQDFLVWWETRLPAAVRIGLWLFLLDFLALVLTLGCLIGLAFLHSRFAVQCDARRIVKAFCLGFALSAFGLWLFNWESGRSKLHIVNDSAMPLTQTSLADDRQRITCGSVGPHSSLVCTLRPQGETELRVSLQVNGLSGEWVYCGYWTGSWSGLAILRVQPSGSVRIEKHC